MKVRSLGLFAIGLLALELGTTGANFNSVNASVPIQDLKIISEKGDVANVVTPQDHRGGSREGWRREGWRREGWRREGWRREGWRREGWRRWYSTQSATGNPALEYPTPQSVSK